MGPGEETRFIDFSYAEYDFGESDLPDKNKFPEFLVTDFRAVADDGLSDKEAIQNAVYAATERKGKGFHRFYTILPLFSVVVN
jgi:hypothetical protein